MMAANIAVLTSSDAGARGERTDESGALLREGLAGLGVIRDYVVLADEADLLRDQLLRWVDAGIDCIATTGGTGLGPRDVMPEVTLSIADRLVPGMAEAMRWASWQKTPFGMLSRGVVAVCRRTLIINFPGSPKAVRELLPVVLPVLPHALDLLRGQTHHGNSPLG